MSRARLWSRMYDHTVCGYGIYFAPSLAPHARRPVHRALTVSRTRRGGPRPTAASGTQQPVQSRAAVGACAPREVPLRPGAGPLLCVTNRGHSYGLLPGWGRVIYTIRGVPCSRPGACPVVYHGARSPPEGAADTNKRAGYTHGLMRFDAHWLAARGEGPSSTCRPRPGGPAPGRRG